MTQLQLQAIEGLPEIMPGNDVALLLIKQTGEKFWEDGDILVVASKIISKSENCIHERASIHPSTEALQIAPIVGRDPKYVELVLRQSERIIRIAPGALITRTHHGFVLANAGVDGSNAGDGDVYLTLPKNPDESARLLSDRLSFLTGKAVGVILSDTFGRAWRQGQTDVAVGCCGVQPFLDYRGTSDRNKRPLRHSVLCCADGLAGAAGLLMGKGDGVPAVRIRGFQPQGGGSARHIPYPVEKDLFIEPDAFS